MVVFGVIVVLVIFVMLFSCFQVSSSRFKNTKGENQKMKKILSILFLSIFCFSISQISLSSSSSDVLSYKDYKSKFSWLTYEMYSAAKKEKKQNNYDVSINFYFSLLETESVGDPKAKGKWIYVKVKKDTYIWTQAYGLGQLIPEFHYIGKNKNNLLIVEENIKISMKVLNEYAKLAKYNPVKTLKNYNSGPYSKYYNWPYINKIIAKALDTNTTRINKIAVL